MCFHKCNVYRYTEKWTNMAVLVAMSVAYRVIAAAFMYRYHTGKK
jgi:hypothetical protein